MEPYETNQNATDMAPLPESTVVYGLEALPKLKPEPIEDLDLDLGALNFVGPDDKLAESIASVEAEQAVLQSPVAPAVLVEPIKEWRIGSTHIKNPA